MKKISEYLRIDDDGNIEIGREDGEPIDIDPQELRTNLENAIRVHARKNKLTEELHKPYVSNITFTSPVAIQGDASYLFSNVFTSSLSNYKPGAQHNFSFDETLTKLNTEAVTNMSYMFTSCEGNLDLSNFNTKNVTNMSSMFANCGMQTLDVSNFDTSNVTNMQGMFYKCHNLRNLDLSGFVTKKVENMSYMFEACQSLETINLKNFDTRCVTDMSEMFKDCPKLKKLDVSNFDTGNVRYMQHMLTNCSSLKSLDVSNFDTKKLIDARCMFKECRSLEKLDISNFNLENTDEADEMFANCEALKEIKLPETTSTQIYSMYRMFANCSELREIDITKLGQHVRANVGGMFENCTNLESIDLSNLSIQNVHDAMANGQNMFENCNGLKRIKLPSNIEDSKKLEYDSEPKPPTKEEIENDPFALLNYKPKNPNEIKIPAIETLENVPLIAKNGTVITTTISGSTEALNNLLKAKPSNDTVTLSWNDSEQYQKGTIELPVDKVIDLWNKAIEMTKEQKKMEAINEINQSETQNQSSNATKKDFDITD